MEQNMNDMLKYYQELSKEADTAWEVYAGERADLLAAKEGISREQWGDARIRMGNGASIFTEELSKGIPNRRELEPRLKAFIGELVDSFLQEQGDEQAQKAYLTRVLSCYDEAPDRESRLPDLRKKTIDLAYNYSMGSAMPHLKEQLKGEAPQQPTPLSNSGALAVSEYLTNPQLRSAPEALGGSCTAVSCCSDAAWEKVGDWISIAGFSLLLAAFMAATFCLLTVGSVSIGSIVCGTSIAKDVALFADEIGIAVKLALGSALVGTVLEALVSFVNWLLDDSSPHVQEDEDTIVIDTNINTRHIDV